MSTHAVFFIDYLGVMAPIVQVSRTFDISVSQRLDNVNGAVKRQIASFARVNGGYHGSRMNDRYCKPKSPVWGMG